MQFLFFNKLNNKITEIVHELYGQPSYMGTKLCTPFHQFLQEKTSTEVNSTTPMSNNSKYGRVYLADFVKEVDRFSRLTEPFAFILYFFDDLRR